MVDIGKCNNPIAEETRLVSLIQKREASQYGDFENINSDLNTFFPNPKIDKNSNVSFGNHEHSNLVKMSYGYAIRQVMAGLYVQGLITRDVYSQVQNCFYALQATTEQTKTFQIEANNQALELLYSYNKKFDNFLISTLVNEVDKGYENGLETGEFYKFDNLMLLLGAMRDDATAIPADV